MTAADGEACAVVATAADIICSLRGADLAGWTPPWRKHEPARDGGKEEGGGGGGDGDGDDDARELAWPAVARGKRSRSSRRESPSASGSAASADAKEKLKKKKKKARRGARGSPASPLDYSGGSGSGSSASTSGGEDGAFCSQPEPPPAALPPAAVAAAACYQQLAAPAAAAPPTPPSKVGGVAGRRTILPVPVAPPRPAGQRARKKMRLPEIQQMVRSLSVENDALRKEMKALQRACTALSQENGKLETRLDQSIKVISVEDKGKKPQPEHQHTAEQEAPSGFVLPDLNLPADV